MPDLEVVYKKRKERFDNLNNKQGKLANLLSNIRLLVFSGGLAAVIILYFTGLKYLCLGAAVVTAFVFAYIVINHSRVLENKICSSSMARINEDSLLRINGEWTRFEDSAEEFVNKDHEYSFDLDIFGRGSLFQMINVTKTYSGRQILRDMLIKPDKDLDKIKKRQEAICELAGKLAWRQRFTAEGMRIKKDSLDPAFLYEWAKATNEFYNKKWVKPVFRTLPVITSLLLLANLALGLVPIYVPVLMLLIQTILLKINSKARSKALEDVNRHKNCIKVYDRMLKMVETNHFKSVHLKGLKENLANGGGLSASNQIHMLSRIVDSISNRYNAFYLVFDILTLWDYQCEIALEQWKKKSGIYMENWIGTIGEIEALSSFSLLRFDNPEWVVPTVSDNSTVYKAGGMGHPLLGAKRVDNDLNFDKNEKVLLITGSNMSGKSTLLRTAGINLVLAYAGAPVCAKSYSCSIMELHTCMRISDNLEKNISSFYAELLRIKDIVKAAREGRRIFFLLDEIFKGTNSIDRHTGAKVLVKKLAECKALGLVSTHDLELGELESEKIKNYHFREYYKNNEIFFDYKLQPGISKTRNAIFLMKMAGIDFEES